MHGRRRSIATAWWVLALFVCTAAGPAVPGFALCVGTDGHVTVEGTHGTDPCATHYEQHHQAAPAQAAVDESPEHGCFDTVLTPPRGERPRDGSQSVAAAAVVAHVVPLRDWSSTVRVSGRSVATERGTSPRLLATTKLRI